MKWLVFTVVDGVKNLVFVTNDRAKAENTAKALPEVTEVKRNSALITIR